MQFCTDLLRCNFLYIRCARNNISFSSHLSYFSSGSSLPPPSTLICQTVELNKPMVLALRLDTNIEYGFYSNLVQNKYEDSEVEDLEEIVIEISVNSITPKVSNANRVLNIYTVRYLFPSYNKRSLFVEVTSLSLSTFNKMELLQSITLPLQILLLHRITHYSI